MVDAAVEAYMDLLIENGFAKRLSRKAPLRYRLTDAGIVELPRRIIKRSYHCQPDEFFFAYSYLENYAPRTIRMMKAKGSYFQFEVLLEVEALLDFDAFIDRQLEISYRELKTLQERIDLLEETQRLMKPLLKKKISDEEILQEVEDQLPLSLHSMLPLSTFYEEWTPKQIVWELSYGTANRREQMWEFQKVRIEQFIEQLNSLRKRSKKIRKTDSRR